jgi:3-hydroxybutyryl-CoA dehydratase
MSHIRNKAISGLEIGDTFSVSRTFSEQDVIQFADISRDYNPIHCEERFSNVKNIDGLICHGLLVACLVTEIGGQIGWLASGMTFEFKKPVYIGDTIKCDFTITEMDEKGRAKAEAVFTNGNNIIVLEAVLIGIVPGAQEKQVMKDMMTEGDPTNKISL